MRYRGASRALIAAAREHRNAPTPAEDALWQAIRRRQIVGARFRRQHALGQVIADFCCPEHRLIIEVDGSSHDDRADYDADRTDHLAGYGYHVLRFTNDEILTNLDSVLSEIALTLRDRTPLPPDDRGEGVGG
jgi:very-short-patch-repair endonuclease